MDEEIVRRNRSEYKNAKKRRRLYFLIQRLIGVLFLTLTILVVISLRDVTIAVFTVPISLLLIFSKKRILEICDYRETGVKT